MDWSRRLVEAFPHVSFQKDEPMKQHTTFRIGGKAEMYVEPTVEQAAEILQFCREEKIPYTILGNGSNVLISDEGISGLVLSFGKQAAKMQVKGKEIHAQAGVLLAQVAKLAQEHSLSGMEFAAGIPGTLGGAMLMNAGAYDGEMAQIVQSATLLLPDGSIQTWKKEEMELSYRHSKMMEVGAIVLSVVLELQPGIAQEIQDKMQDFRQRRMEKQPLEFPSAGSTFKRPVGYFAGKLIMDAGLAGYQVGGAKVSEKHCGFVVNAGDATAKDVKDLMQHVTQVVKEKYQVELEPEVRFLGKV